MILKGTKHSKTGITLREFNMQNKNKRLTPLQLILTVIVLVVIGIYRYYTAGTDLSTTITQIAPLVTSIGADVTEIAPEEITDTAPVDEETEEPLVPISEATVTATQKALKTPVTNSGAMKAFDYFVLSLSWSPDYCATSGSDDEAQCSIGKKLNFVLHGLWPQNQKGYPSNCSNEKISSSVKQKFSGLYPSTSLIDHEWEKHGTCTGLSAEAYFTLSQQLKNSVVLPEAYRSPLKPFKTNSDQLKQDFVAVNPDLNTNSLAVYCSGSGRYLKELYVCFDREDSPMACGAEVNKAAAKSCQQASFLVRNIR
jgi:ribonuclease T2